MAVSNAICLITAGLALGVVACGPAEGPREITKSRIVQPMDPDVLARVRSRSQGMGSPGSIAGSAPGSASGSSSGAAAALVHFTLPEGWVELPNSSMRAANFTLEADERVECYLTQLPGEAGGLAANVNRWRGQMGLPDQSAEEIAALEPIEFMGVQGVQMDVVGSWSGMGGGSGESGWRMLGILAVSPGGSSFLKMVGPDEVVAAERGNFLAVAGSMHSGEGHSHGDAPTASGAPMGGAAEGGMAGLAGGLGGDVPAPPRSVASGISWQAPEAWSEAPERPFRAANYHAGSMDVEAYVTVLPGDAGGPLANVNRWRGQMGQSALSVSEFDQLPRVEMLGGSGLVVEIEGTFQSMSGDVTSDAMMIGALGQVTDRSVFVKMIGPAELVLDQRGAFLEFCNSLETVSGS